MRSGRVLAVAGVAAAAALLVSAAAVPGGTTAATAGPAALSPVVSAPATAPATRRTALDVALRTRPGARSDSTITWSGLPLTARVGDPIAVRITLRPKAIAKARGVTVQARPPGGRWTVVSTGTTDKKGRLTTRVIPAEAGAWRYRATAGATARAGRARTPVARVTVTAATPGPTTRTVYAVGDIGDCRGVPASTAALIPAGTDDPLLLAGDIAYPLGRPEDFADCYDPAYGSFTARALPVPGNHEYYTDEGAGYFGYFGARAGRFGDSWYSRDIGAWHVVLLDSNCGAVGGCGTTSPQYAWLRADLAAWTAAAAGGATSSASSASSSPGGSSGQCLAAVWHHPRWSSGEHGSNDEDVRALYALLHDAGADLLVSGHDHDYERFARLAPNGRASDSGVRQFVVGTGGTPLRDLGAVQPYSQERSADTHGVLRLSLRDDGYSWRFLPVAGSPFTDVGADTC